ncbi:MAG: ComF family protein, partial [Oscillospiraceae bacterium]|nr:ComF family protein [Oscillospiraceae bacterium]
IRDYSARKANVLGVFAEHDAVRFEGKRVLLIDDVITSGATLSECSRVLLTAGADSVVCATFAATREKEKKQ